MPPSREWLIIGIYPDVCLTKGFPVPYIIVSEAEAAGFESPDVAYNGFRAMNLGSEG